jgi:hypothetical protein
MPSRAVAARILMVAASVFLAAHCTEPTAVPNAVPGPEGHWIMVAVDGNPLPADISPGVTMLSGDLDLFHDGTYVKHTTASVAGVEFHATSTGRWSADGGRIALNPSVGDREIGDWRDAVIEIHDVRSLRYVPVSALPPTPPSSTPTAGGSRPGGRIPRYSISPTTAGSARP